MCPHRVLEGADTGEHLLSLRLLPLQLPHEILDHARPLLRHLQCTCPCGLQAGGFGGRTLELGDGKLRRRSGVYQRRHVPMRRPLNGLWAVLEISEWIPRRLRYRGSRPRLGLWSGSWGFICSLRMIGAAEGRHCRWRLRGCGARLRLEDDSRLRHWKIDARRNRMAAGRGEGIAAAEEEQTHSKQKNAENEHVD